MGQLGGASRWGWGTGAVDYDGGEQGTVEGEGDRVLGGGLVIRAVRVHVQCWSYE